MSKSRTITLSAFNIVTHPHSPEAYEQLFYSAQKLGQIIKIWGDTHALLRMAYKLDDYSVPIITGEIFTFLEIDVKADWFDILKGEAINAEQTGEVKIPEHLRPHLKRIRYLFFPNSHTFVYTRNDSAFGSISPNRMADFLKKLLNDNRLLENAPFQAVDIRLVQDKTTLGWIFENLQVEKLDIAIKTPNGDTAGDAEKSVEEELEDQNIEEYFISQTAIKGKSIQPDRRTRRLMDEATENGYVEAKGTDANDISRIVNTRERPLVEPIRYDDNKPYMAFMVEAATKLLEKMNRGSKPR